MAFNDCGAAHPVCANRLYTIANYGQITRLHDTILAKNLYLCTDLFVYNFEENFSNITVSSVLLLVVW
jgi:hypothetical protein